MTHVPTITDDDFDSEVLRSDRPVLVDFGADWCAPCRQIAPVLEQLAAEHHERLRVVKVDVDESPVTSARYGVIGLPTLIVYQGGEAVRHIVGARPKRMLVADLAEFLQ